MTPKQKTSLYELSHMAPSILARNFLYPSLADSSLVNVFRETLTCAFMHVIMYFAYRHLIYLFCDIINRYSTPNKTSILGFITNLGVSRAIQGKDTVLYVYIIGWTLNALLRYSFGLDQSSPYMVLVMPIAWVCVETLLLFCVTLAVTLLLRVVELLRGVGLDDKANSDMSKITKIGKMFDDELDEARAGKKTIM